MHVPLPAPAIEDLLGDLEPALIARMVQLEETSEYLHWDKVMHLPPPEGLTSRQWWLGLKLGRLTGRKRVPLLDTRGVPFHFSAPDQVLRLLHTLDQQLAGRITMSESITSEGSRDRYLVSSLIEEAITSSQLEGAVTSRRVAQAMLRSGRSPRDTSELMIANNLAAMHHVREARRDPLTPALVCELHRIVTLGTLDDPHSAGRIEQPTDQRVRVWGHEDQLLHTPPPAVELPARLAACAPSPTVRTTSASCTPWCGRSSCTSGWATTTTSRTATVVRREPSSTGRCCTRDTG